MLTAQEIEAADCIIVAADAQVPMDRFDGKRVIECQVSDGISKAPGALERAASGEVPVYHAASSGNSSPAKAASGGKSGSVGHQIYTQLMNGVSHMLPFVVGGGMIASQGKSGFLGALAAGFIAGYLILALRKACENLPEALEKIAPVLIYPVVGVLLIGLVMSFVVEPVMGAINMALNNGLSSMGGSSKLILGFVLAAMMAIDMGGPFNKAAYVFGTAAIASGNYDVMAAVMIGGMTPPCAIALATMLFKKKFTKEEREAGPTNFIMGLAFITEGAIPFAASDPVHVLPACIVGSGVAGAMSMLFNCTLMAPHGGIFVFPVMGNPLFYLLALVVGMAISTVLLGVLKKNVEE